MVPSNCEQKIVKQSQIGNLASIQWACSKAVWNLKHQHFWITSLNSTSQPWNECTPSSCHWVGIKTHHWTTFHMEEIVCQGQWSTHAMSLMSCREERQAPYFQGYSTTMANKHAESQQEMAAQAGHRAGTLECLNGTFEEVGPGGHYS